MQRRLDAWTRGETVKPTHRSSHASRKSAPDRSKPSQKCPGQLQDTSQTRRETLPPRAITAQNPVNTAKTQAATSENEETTPAKIEGETQRAIFTADSTEGK